MRHALIPALAALLVISTACGPKETPEPPAPVEEAPAPTVDEDAEAEAARRAAEEAARRAAEEARRTEASLTERVFFDYDVANIREDQRAILDQKVEILQAHPSIRLRIEGHADDRGSTEYNLALGERRARAVMDYLVDFGVDEERLEIVSYGEERPLASGQNETSWAQNRRAEFVIVAGGVVAEGDEGS